MSTAAMRARSRRFMCVPAFTAAPAITGTPANGQTLTCSPGTFRNGTVSARQWRRGGVVIAGATGSTYVCQAADIGLPITVSVTITNALNSANTVTATSPPTAAVAA